jgi:outer membrane protein assembly factor BamE (lipoprotein component of BamABCDE complex)
MQRRIALSCVVLLALGVAACAAFSFGREFPSPKPGAEIRNGTTAKADLLKMFGEPTQVGVKDGDQTWTWYYAKKGSDREYSKTLDVTFGPEGVVKSYSFSSNFPEDMKAR